MTNVIFARGSTDRKPAFQLITTLRRTNKGIVAVKAAARPEAKAHLQSLVTKNELLKKVGLSCRPVAIEQSSEQEIVFSFVKGQSLEKRFQQAVRNWDLEAMVSALNAAFGVVDSLPVSKLNPTEQNTYKEIFGSAYDYVTDCANPAFVDFNLDNLIEGSEGLTIIDYEWVYDFAVPKSFIKLRLLHHAFLEAQTILLKRRPEENMVFFGENLFIPQQIYDQFSDLFDDTVNYLEANVCFANYIQLHQVSGVANRVEKKILSAGELLEVLTPYSAGQPRFIKQRAMDAVHIRNQEAALHQQSEELAVLQNKLSRLQHTFSYRFLGRLELRLRPIVGKFTRRLK